MIAQSNSNEMRDKEEEGGKTKEQEEEENKCANGSARMGHELINTDRIEEAGEWLTSRQRVATCPEMVTSQTKSLDVFE